MLYIDPTLTLITHRVGSLYFKDSGISGCQPAEIESGPENVKDTIRSRFCIGPIVRREFWEKERSHMHQYQGPCKFHLTVK
jgi:hypothetical protein